MFDYLFILYLGSKGSSPSRTASSSGDSPGGSRPLSKTYDNNMTFTRSSYDQDQSPDRSLGQSIRSSARRRSIQSGNAYDHSHRSLRYGNNYSRDSTAGTVSGNVAKKKTRKKKMGKKIRQTKLRTYKFNFFLLLFFSEVLQGQSNP